MPKKVRRGKRGNRNVGKPSGSFQSRQPRFVSAMTTAVSPIIPDRMFTVLKACTTLTTSDSVAGDDLVIMANSAFDPFQSEGSLQPQGFDQWAGFYQFYKVWRTRIRVSSIPISGTGTSEDSVVVVVADNTVTPITSTSQALSAPYNKWRLVGHGTTVSLNAFSSLDKKLSMNMSTQKMFGVSATTMEGNSTYGAVTTANPTATWFYHVVNITRTGSNISRFTHVVELEQHIEFWDRLPLADAEKGRQKVRQAYAERKVLNKRGSPQTGLGSVKLVSREKAVKDCKEDKESNAAVNAGSKWSEESDDDESVYAQFVAWKSGLDRGDEKSTLKKAKE